MRQTRLGGAFSARVLELVPMYSCPGKWADVVNAMLAIALHVRSEMEEKGLLLFLLTLPASSGTFAQIAIEQCCQL